MVNIKALACLLGVASLATALPGKSHTRRCADLTPSAELVASHSSLRDAERAAITNNQSPKHAGNDTIALDVYFHVAASADKHDDISDATMSKQWTVLRDAYAKYGVAMTLKDTSRTYDDNIATGLMDGNGDRDAAQEAAFQKFTRSVRKGGYDTLNVYFYTNFAKDGGLLGLCYFPESTTQGSDTFWQDGCQINGNSVPGGSSQGFDLGLTAVHEVGHWFGLFHVFQDQSCGHDGDLVDDTPFQSKATSGCPKGQDSCPKSKGLDSIHNYMDYSSDACYTEFTAGQSVRLHAQYKQFRAGK